MNDYYEEIEHLIKRYEINRRVRKLEDNSLDLKTKWEIGKLIFEAQGGESKAKYGNGFIKEWSKSYASKYGNGYSERNLRYFRQFYNLFPIWQPVVSKLCWSHYILLLPIKDENKRNYYINLVIENNLSKRQLSEEIKNNSYERLVDRSEKIEIVQPKNNLSIRANLKNPIIITLNKDELIENEHDLQVKLLSELQAFFRQLGSGYTLVVMNIK